MSDHHHDDEAELARLAAVERYRIMDTDPEQSFDDITALAAEMLGMPTALISLLDAHRQWFKSRVGLDLTETDRDISFCNHTIQGSDMMVVEDATTDRRFEANPLVTGDGGIRFYAGIPIRADDGEPLGTLCVIDSVPRALSSADRATLERLARLVEELLALRLTSLQAQARQQQLEEQHAITERILGSVAEAVVACNGAGELTVFNATARHWLGADITGLSPDVWATHYNLYEPDGRTLLKPGRVPLMRALQGESLRDEEISIAAQDQALRHVSCSGGPLKDAEGRLMGAVIVMHDSSERKRTELMKRNFLAAVSHELRTPLTSISGAIELVLGGATGEVPGGASKILDMARTNAARLNVLINDLLDIEKLQSGHMRLTLRTKQLLPLLQRAVEANQPYAANYSVSIQLDAVPADIHVVVDAYRLLQVMDNFLSNAAKFSHPGGMVRVACSVADGHVQISVTDKGIGIAEADHESLFKVFSQVDNSSIRQHGGTGLGLSIARQLVERMGGTVGFSSRLGKGSVFWYRLPLVQAGELPPTPVA